MSANAVLPSLFVPHGAPTFALRPGAAGAALARTAAGLPQPRAVVVVSAHWDMANPTVGLAERPQTIHDYFGFPAELVNLRYPATGCREAAGEVLARLRAAGLPAQADEGRGLDHGAWIPLRHMYPDADVPVTPLSIQGRLGPAHHLAVGRALAPLAAQGFLILASGNLTHNLRDFQLIRAGAATVPPYVRQFADWIWQRLAAGDEAALVDYRARAPGAVRAHPTEEHLLPLYVALGAAGGHGRAERLHAGIDDYVLATDAFAFHPGERP